MDATEVGRGRSARLFSGIALAACLATSALFAAPALSTVSAQAPAWGSAVDLDDAAGQWGVSVDTAGRPPGCARAGGQASNVSQPSTTGWALKLDHLGGDCYVGVHFYRNLLAQPSAQAFRYAVAYRLPPTTLDNRGDYSLIQNIQFSFSKWHRNTRWECAWQLQVVRDPTDENAPGYFRLWDGRGWVDTGLLADLTPDVFHFLEFDCGVSPSGMVSYPRLRADGREVSLGGRYTYPPQPGDGYPDRLSVAVQLDSNVRGQPYTVYMDGLGLTWW